MTVKKAQRIKRDGRFVDYLIIIVIGFVLLYPILWMLFATFKDNAQIFGSTRLFPTEWHLENYTEGWKGSSRVSYTQFFINTFALVIPTTLLTVVSACLTAYAFARFDFPCKKLLFTLLIGLMLLPGAVVIIPRYLLYNKFHWIDSYLPFYVPGALACNSFFSYMLIQFLRGIPRDLDESAYMDGCGSLRTLVQILLPLMKPALFSAGLFQFLWTYNDYFNSLIFISSQRKYPISMALRMSLDSESVVNWGKVMAMAFVAVLPVMILFFAAQKYFVEGIATTGLKG